MLILSSLVETCQISAPDTCVFQDFPCFGLSSPYVTSNIKFDTIELWLEILVMRVVPC